jgi:hypothetical protein
LQLLKKVSKEIGQFAFGIWSPTDVMKRAYNSAIFSINDLSSIVGLSTVTNRVLNLMDSFELDSRLKVSKNRNDLMKTSFQTE